MSARAAVAEDLVRGQKLGNCELLLRIGRGGMATVWVARQRGATRDEDRLVALKAIHHELAEEPEFVKMFLDEGRLAKSIHHPNVVDVYEVDEHDGVMYMVMEWVEGDSLHAVIAEAGKRKPIPPEMAVRMMADASSALHAAHELRDEQGKLLGVVHRDVSPHNILIGTNGAIKLVDFGVAKAMGRIADATSAGQLKGKFSYMSPEQAMAKPVDRRSDIFALGIVLFELTTGRRLFRGEHDAETLHLVANAEVPKPSSVEAGYPKALEDIVLKCLQREKDRRYQTALEVQRALEGYLKAERIVVARSGLAGLLKKVLGTRIEQRRRAVRAAIKAIDGASTTLPAVTGELLDPGGITSPSGLAEISGVSGVGSQPSGVSQPSGQSGAGSGPHSGVSQGAGSQPSVSQPGFSHSGVSHVSGPTGPTSAGFPQTIGASPPARGVPGWMLGLGAVALLLAGLVLAVALGAGRTTVVVQAPAAAPAAAVTTATAAASTTTAATPAPAATGSVPTLDFDSLPKGTTSPPQAGPKTAEPAAPRATATAAPVAPKPAAGAVGLPRENPYR